MGLSNCDHYTMPTLFRYGAFGMAAVLIAAIMEAEPGALQPIVIESPIPTLTPTRASHPMQSQIPNQILEPILKEAAALANISREQLVIVRAERALWNDGSLGCAQPGNMYTQAQVNGYWVIIKARGQTYDFRADSRGSFILCPPGQGRPPSEASTK